MTSCVLHLVLVSFLATALSHFISVGQNVTGPEDTPGFGTPQPKCREPTAFEQ